MTPAPAVANRGSQLPTMLIGAALLVLGVVFAISGGEWFDAFLAVHIIFVVVWIGGGAALTILGIVAELTNDRAQLAVISKQAAFLGQRVFAPAAIVVVVMGGAMVQNAHIGYGHFWIVFGLLGFLATFVIGLAVLSPMADKLNKLIAEKGPDSPEAIAGANRILLVARADVAMLLLVIVDMTTKPFS